MTNKRFRPTQTYHRRLTSTEESIKNSTLYQSTEIMQVKPQTSGLQNRQTKRATAKKRGLPELRTASVSMAKRTVTQDVQNDFWHSQEMALVARPLAPSSFLFLVVRPGAPSSILAPSTSERVVAQSYGSCHL